MHNYFVVGLPRSRTSWLANLLSTGHSLCLHEPTRYVRTPEALSDLFEQIQDQYGYRSIGVSDSGLLLYPKLIPSKSTVVIVRRDIEDVIASVSRHFEFDATALVHHLDIELSRIAAAHKDHLAVNFNDLDSESVCRSVFSLCLPSEPWCPLRWKQLSRLSIMPRLEHVLDDMEIDNDLLLRLRQLAKGDS